MKIRFQKKYNSIALYSCLVLLCLGVAVALLFRFDLVASVVTGFLSILRPVLFAFATAYLLNPLVSFLERKVLVFSTKDRKKFILKRLLSIVITFLLVLALVALILFLFVPSLVASYDNLTLRISGYSREAQSLVNSFLSRFSIESVGTSLQSASDSIFSWFSSAVLNLLPNLVSYASNVFSGIVDAFIAIVLSITFLAEKEKYAARFKKILSAVLPQKWYDRFIGFASYTDKTFGGFLVGKIIDSLIIGVLTFVVLALFRIPYYEMISLFVCVTNMIPYFGPIIGAIPSAFLIFIAEPDKTILFIVIILIIQQLDGNVIGPRIIGGATGLSSLGVITSILLMGHLMGFVGYFIAVPLFAVIKRLCEKGFSFLEQRKNKKKETLPDPDEEGGDAE